MTMKAVAHRKTGGVEVLEVLDLPKPVPTEHDLLVKVVAVATNPVDGKIRASKGIHGTGASIVVDPPKILGYDCAGVVEVVGANVTKFKPGDEVYFAGRNQANGANAEYTVVDNRIAALKPKSLNWEQAAAMPLCTLTGWEGLIEGAGIPIPPESGPNPNANKSLLIIGGAGGVGSVGIQIAKKVLKIGAVIATASRPETTEWCKKLGADYVINHQKNLAEELVAIGFPKGVHYVYCTTDLNKAWDNIIPITRAAGKIIAITSFSDIDVTKLVAKRLTLVAEFMFARINSDEEPEHQGEILARLAHLIDTRVIHHVQNHHFEWNQIKEAQALQDSGKAIGKITLTVKF